MHTFALIPSLALESTYFMDGLQAYIQKTQFFIFFTNWEKLRSPIRATFKNPKMYLLIGKNVEVQPKTNTQKIPILNLWMNWENSCPNLSLAVENKIGNLHKIRLFTFQT